MDATMFTNVLAGCVNTDHNVRVQAEQVLADFKNNNFAVYVQSLANELANNEKPPEIRRIAGSVLKLALYAKDENEKRNVAQRWLSLDANVRNSVKNAAFSTLASPCQPARQATTQVVSYIACIELPVKAWPELIDLLLKNMNEPNDELKQSTLETLGYICEETDVQSLALQSNQILTAVCKGIQEKNPEVSLTGLRAMCNALEFVKSNFEKEIERNFIMQVICDSCESTSPKLRQIALECLVKVGNLYYDKLAPYMQRIFAITLKAIKQDEEEVTLQAIEFWCTICDEESEIFFEQEEYPETARQSQHFIKGSLQYLVPHLLEALTKQDDEPEEDLWTVPNAAGTCLSLVTNVVEDEVVPIVMPFIEKCITNPNWKFKEAATLAFGAILEGPKNLSAMIANAMPVLLGHMKDPVVYVKDTTAWTIGRVCQLHPAIVATGLSSVMSVLVESLDDSPRVSSYVCWAIHNLASSFSGDSSSNELSPFFAHLLQKLMQISERSDADESNLRGAASEAIDSLIQASAKDCQPTIAQAIPIFVERLAKTIANKTAYGNEQRIEVQSLLCATLQGIARKLGPAVLQYSDAFMDLFLRIPSTHEKVTTAHEEALMAIGAVANAIEGEFNKYMPHLRPFLVAGLKNSEEYTVCSVSVGLVGDIARAINNKISPYCDEIITILLSDLQSATLHRDVKPPILSAFGDIALAIGKDFQKYLYAVMDMLNQASQMTVPANDYDLVDYLNSLREGISEAYTGIILGLKNDEMSDLFLPHVQTVLKYVEFVWNDSTKSDEVVRGLVGVIADIAHTLGSKVKQNYVGQPVINTIIAECCKSGDSTTRENALWARQLVSQL
eukprot:TRINITY_DN2471_c0_g1_i1.p1 TRINITY_DN2471_c0_g1~~TRINITY_DN2471_c0_g1_i1.p1  ORF type:complete len:845 (-),score=225.27 TRINITY_DN2471_c0_g1_i1:390-2924(-)